jgi:EAL domain-containing protein (putative c-di-GMP-specific phosphodiesterase class I)
MAIVVMTVLLAALFLAGADRLHHKVVSAFNRESVADLAQGALTRAEIATDYAIIKLGLLHEEGHTDCSPESIAAVNYAVFSSGSIKDILTADGDVVCSAAMHSETLAKNHSDPIDSAPARNPRIVLNPLRMDNTSAMAVTWKFTDTTLATALVNTESLVFDILPAELRTSSAVRLSLSNGRTVGSFSGPQWKIGGDTELFEVKSERYPLAVRIHVPVALLNNLNMKRSTGAEISVGSLAVLLAYLVARGLVPSSNAASRIRRALRRGEIVPYFQPAYDVRSGEITSFEVLARWPGQSGPMASPAFFVPLIESNGWSDDLLEAMIVQTAQAMRSVLATAPAVKFAFNASPAQLAGPLFSAWLSRVLQRAELDAARVVIEITEREEIGDIDKARQSIESLKKMGIEVALDDAGTGHNGLASVQRLGAAVLKIDKLFIDGIGKDPRAGSLVQMLVDVAREFGMRTVAEGVEDEDQLAALNRLGVDQVQGFFLCKPLDAIAAAHELAHHQAVLARNRMQQEKAKQAAIASGKVVAINA